MPRLIVLLVLLSLPLSASESDDARDLQRFDYSAGLWIPPGCPFGLWAHTKPQCDYVASVKKAFEADPLLARQICGWKQLLSGFGNGGSADQKTKSVELTAICVAYPSTREDRNTVRSWEPARLFGHFAHMIRDPEDDPRKDFGSPPPPVAPSAPAPAPVRGTLPAPALTPPAIQRYTPPSGIPEDDYTRFAATEGVWYPLNCPNKRQHWGSIGCDYADEVRAAFSKDAGLARRVCAWRSVVLPNPWDDAGRAASDDLVEACTSVRYTADDLLPLAQVPIFQTLTHQGRDVYLALLEKTDGPLAYSRFSAGINVWLPPPCHRSVSRASCDYADAVRAAFTSADTRLRVCTWKSMLSPVQHSAERSARMERQLDDACRGFVPTEQHRNALLGWPVFGVNDPRGVRQAHDPGPLPTPSRKDYEQGEAYLAGVINGYLGKAEAMNPDARRRAAGDLIARIPTIQDRKQQYLATIELMSLAPDETATTQLLFRHRRNLIGYSDPRLEFGAIEAAIERAYAKQMRTPGGDAWKRGWRNHLTSRGRFDEALPLARELAAGGRPELRARDEIALSVLEKLTGDGARYAELMANCPKADPLWVAMYGAPSRADHYCNDVVASLVGTIREAMDDEAPELVADLWLDTRRLDVVSAADQSTSRSVAVLARPGEEIPAFIRELMRHVETADGLSEAERWQQASDCGFGGASSLRVLALRPHSLVAMRGVQGTYFFEDNMGAEAGRNAMLRLAEQRVRSGPRSEEWEGALVNLHLLLGNLETARDLGRKRRLDSRKETDSEAIVQRAVLERVFGDRRPLDALLAGNGCPPPSRCFLLNEFEEDRPFYCHVQSQRILDFIVDVMQKSTPPSVVEMLQEYGGRHPDRRKDRVDAAESLMGVNLELAKAQFEKALRETDEMTEHYGMGESRLRAYTGLLQIAAAQRDEDLAVLFQESALSELGHARRPVSHDVWERVRKVSPKLQSAEWPDETFYAAIIEAALARNDWETARRVTDLYAEVYVENPARSPHRVRLLLDRIAAAMIDAGLEDDARQILGYLAHGPIDQYLAMRIDFLRKRISGDPNQPVDIDRELTPWPMPQGQTPLLRPETSRS